MSFFSFLLSIRYDRPKGEDHVIVIFVFLDSGVVFGPL